MANIAQKGLKKPNEKGFTLIEMAIVVAIVGMILAATAQLYSQRVRYLQVEDTKVDVESTITQALGGFLDTNGRFPCPASLTAVRGAPVVPGQPAYGRETDCDDGVLHTIVASGVVTTPDNVRIGTVPFKELGLDENDTIDGYHNRIIYAVTESQAVQDSFASDGGVITLLDEDADIANPVADNLHYVLYSTGANGVGGYSREGFQTQPCDLLSREGQNCDFADSTFIAAQQATANTNMEYDDIITFNTLSDMPQWEESDGPTENINAKATGSLGIGPGASNDPEEELDVIGIVRAQDNPDTTELEGNIISSNLCENRTVDGGGNEITKCFPSALIGQEGSPHPDMQCPTGQFMLAINNGKAECSSNVEIACPIGQLMIGINADGSPECNIPLLGCPSASVLVCYGQPQQTLLPAKHGDYKTVSSGIAGNPRKQTYKCNNGNWQKHGGASGLCSCDAGVTSTQGRACKVWSSCGDRFTGSFQRTYSRQCPSGKTVYSDDRASCGCIESVKYDYPSCGWGYNTGYKKRENKHNCTTQKCGGWNTIHNSCGCKEETYTKWDKCPSGFNGYYQSEKKRQCLSGPTGKYTDTAWTQVPGNTKLDRCTCAASSYTRKESCPDGQYGDIATLVEFTCPDTTQSPIRTETEIITQACKPLPPIQCKWQWPTGAKGEDRADYPAGIPADTVSCSCDTEQGDKKKCAQPSGSKFIHENCICEVTSSE